MRLVPPRQAPKEFVSLGGSKPCKTGAFCLACHQLTHTCRNMACCRCANQPFYFPDENCGYLKISAGPFSVLFAPPPPPPRVSVAFFSFGFPNPFSMSSPPPHPTPTQTHPPPPWACRWSRNRVPGPSPGGSLRGQPSAARHEYGPAAWRQEFPPPQRGRGPATRIDLK